MKVVYLGPVAPTGRCTASSETAASSTSSASALARLQLLPPHDSQFRRNREGVARDAERERLIVEWDLGYEEPETAQPGLGGSRAAALPASPSHALPVPGEPCAVGESWLRAFSLA